MADHRSAAYASFLTATRPVAMDKETVQVREAEGKMDGSNNLP